jgi:3-carboxy-cis,cis-muconate cycloisomerase
MAATVGASGEGALATALAAALEPSLGTGAAHDAAADAVRQARETGRPLSELLAGRPEIDVAALAPDVGEAGAQVDAVLAEHRRLTEGTA